MTTPPNTALAGRGIKPWVSLRAHPGLAAASLLLVLLLGIPFAWFKGTPHYVSSASLYVSPRFIKNLKDDQELEFQSNNQYRQYVEQQVNNLRRYDILEDAMTRFPRDLAGWHKPGAVTRQDIAVLQESLLIRAIPDTYLIEVSLKRNTPQGLAEAVNAVVRSYLLISQSEDIYAADKRIQNLRQRQAQQQAEIQRKSQQRSHIAEELGVTTFIDSEINPYDKLLVDLQTNQQAAKQRLMEAEARLSSFQRSQAADDNGRAISDIVQVDPGLNSLKANLNQRRAGLVSQISGLTAKHPARIAAEQEMAEIEQELNSQEARLVKRVTSDHLNRYQSAVQQARQVLQQLDDDLAAQRQRSRQYSTLYNNALTLNADIAGIRKELDDITQRIGFLQLESNAPGFVRLNSLALPPHQPSGGGRTKLLIIILLMAPVLAVMVPVAIDLADQRLHTANDLHKLFGFAPSGWIVESEDAATERFAIDQYRRLAANLGAALQDSSRRSMVVTSVKPGGGSSTVALRLAGTLANLGRRSLVIELNSFASDQRYGERAPLQDWLKGDCALTDCVQAAGDGLPERIRLAPETSPSLSFLPALLAQLPQLQQQYDIILLDAPPILLSADSEILVRELGQVMLVAQALGINRGEALRAGRLLEKLAPSLLAVVLNRVRVYHGGGYLAQLVDEFNGVRKPANAWPARLLAKLSPNWPFASKGRR